MLKKLKNGYSRADLAASSFRNLALQLFRLKTSEEPMTDKAFDRMLNAVLRIVSDNEARNARLKRRLTERNLRLAHTLAREEHFFAFVQRFDTVPARMPLPG
jgi:hypothetical protein